MGKSSRCCQSIYHTTLATLQQYCLIVLAELDRKNPSRHHVDQESTLSPVIPTKGFVLRERVSDSSMTCYLDNIGAASVRSKLVISIKHSLHRNILKGIACPNARLDSLDSRSNLSVQSMTRSPTRIEKSRDRTYSARNPLLRRYFWSRLTAMVQVAKSSDPKLILDLGCGRG